MAAIQTVKATSISIEIQKGLDEAGDPVYTKKTFSKVKNGVSADDVFEICSAIKGIISTKTRDTLVNVTSSIKNNA